MKNYPITALTAIFSLFMLFHPAMAQEQKGPGMVLEEQVFDFKKVDEGQILEHTFQVHNRGDQPLEIKGVKPG